MSNEVNTSEVPSTPSSYFGQNGKATQEKVCVDATSVLSSTHSEGPAPKKKFTPTIPPSRNKKEPESKSFELTHKKNETYNPRNNSFNSRPPFHSRQGGRISNHSNNRQHQHQNREFNPHQQPRQYNFNHRNSFRFDNNQPAFRRNPPPPPVAVVPYSKPELVQTEGCLFGDGVFNEKGIKRKVRNQTEKPLDMDDPVMIALNLIDNYELYGNTQSFPAPIQLNPPVHQEASTTPSINEESSSKSLVLHSACGELITVHPNLAEKLKSHQIEGVKFMWNACFKLGASDRTGCVLAHCMGLGKSLQVVTLAHTVLTHAVCEVIRVMVVCPLSTVLNWLNEFKIWFPKETLLTVFELSTTKQNKAREEKTAQWFQTGGILIIGYEMYRTLTNEKPKKGKASDGGAGESIFHKYLVDPGPDVVFCDEGHVLKNEESELFKAMNKIKTKCRVMLTGTPLQNSLFEYHTMVQFVKPGQLGTKSEFSKRFVLPLEKGHAADSTPADVRAMKRRALILHKLLEHTVQRFDSNVLAPFLPPKYEYVVSVRMSDLQIKLYCYYLEHYTKSGSTQPADLPESAGLFSDFQELARVWTHPKALLLAARRREAKTVSQSKDSKAKSAKKKTTKTDDFDDDFLIWADKNDNGGEGYNETGQSSDMEVNSSSAPKEKWWSNLIANENLNSAEHSGKIVLLMDILQQCALIGDKILVFSQSLTTLDLIEEFLAVEDMRNQVQDAGTRPKVIGTWSLNEDYFRLDGATSSEQRQKWCSAFNDPLNVRSRLFLISTRAGGIGINLVGANRAIIFDASWNPSHDLQSVYRVYRLGQKKPCFVYRFVGQGTMEEKVYYRQVAKLSISRCVVDDEQMERYFGSRDLVDLYTFNPDGLLSLPAPELWGSESPTPKDTLLADLALRRRQWLGAFREHDSLLQNRPEELLEETEQQAIWKVFEREKANR